MHSLSFAKILLSLQLFVLYTLAADASYTSHRRIINGKETSISKYPHQVSLRFANTGKHFCGGAILSAVSIRWILTSAQCTQGSKSLPQNVYIIVGSSNLTNGGQRYNLEQILNHPQFDWAKRKNDISMLKTDQPIGIINGVIFPIDFPSFKTDYLIENNIGLISVVLTGWGTFRLSENSAEEVVQSNRLRYQESYILARNGCRRHLGHVNGLLLSDDHLCTSVRSGEGMCIGDVGSPLITKNGEVVGIASWRGSNCGSGYPDVYTRIFPHLNWIWNNIIDGNCT